MTALRWSDVLVDPLLQNLPYKIELNRWGRIEMAPTSNRHGLMQVRVAGELDVRPGGQVLVGCSLQTTDGVRVADVAWVSDARLAEFGDATPWLRAPELCVEIMSASNTWGEMHMKAGLYLQAGAQEVWIVPLHGHRVVVRV